MAYDDLWNIENMFRKLKSVVVFFKDNCFYNCDKNFKTY